MAPIVAPMVVPVALLVLAGRVESVRPEREFVRAGRNLGI